MSTGATVAIVGGILVLGGGILFLTHKKSTLQVGGNKPPLMVNQGAVQTAQTPQQQLANIAGQAGGVLATQGFKALEDLFN